MNRKEGEMATQLCGLALHVPEEDQDLRNMLTLAFYLLSTHKPRVFERIALASEMLELGYKDAGRESLDSIANDCYGMMWRCGALGDADGLILYGLAWALATMDRYPMEAWAARLKGHLLAGKHLIPTAPPQVVDMPA
jgi:hypothetical protein